jgi:hypothetical protein
MFRTEHTKPIFLVCTYSAKDLVVLFAYLDKVSLESNSNVQFSSQVNAWPSSANDYRIEYCLK